ncbi:uncharacterized protein LOC6051724 [Culex quinquefasciatus]|uniref:uncharacterized protein LOC6051724 n=1 Tax=Culex quinquefasciatus TaxID=7176 RepID=UPI0018E37FD1|nr:uncharacterized protein LOC6051724 [Culex quinquefasciatus]
MAVRPTAVEGQIHSKSSRVRSSNVQSSVIHQPVKLSTDGACKSWNWLNKLLLDPNLCESDVLPIFRQAVITSLGRNYRTIPYILKRVWDVDERVRRHTYIQISSYPVKQYIVAQRFVKIVLIPQWFESYQKNNVAFVKALKIDADEKEMERFAKTAKLALGEIFTKYGLNDATTMLGLREEDKTIPLKNLTIETAICWQALLKILQHTDSYELDAYMVDLTAFGNYIKTFADTPTLCKYIRQLAYDPSMTRDMLQKMYFQSMMQVLLEIVRSG